MNAPIHPRPDTLFQPGNRHGEKRRGHKGARAKLASLVFDDVMAHWEEQGQGFLRRLAFHSPEAFAAFVAKILPQRIEHEHVSPFDDVDEALLAISLRLSKAIAFLPPEDRELLDMLLTKGERLADAAKAQDATSQENFSGHAGEEGVGGQSVKIFSGGEGSPHPLYAATPDRQIANSPGAAAPIGGFAAAADPVGESATVSAPRVIDEDVIDADYEE